MPRPPRFDRAGYTRHAIQRGGDRRDIFLDDQDFAVFERYLAETVAAQDCALHAYVLMNNHFHLLLTPTQDGGLARLLQGLGRRYVPYFNRRYERSGGLFESRYRATLIDTDGYFLACSRYVEMNPVRAGLCQLPGQYTWSSYRANAEGAPGRPLTPHPLYQALGVDAASRGHAYRALFEEMLVPGEVDLIRERTNKGWALGDGNFARRVEADTGLAVAPRKRGRRPGFSPKGTGAAAT